MGEISGDCHRANEDLDVFDSQFSGYGGCVWDTQIVMGDFVWMLSGLPANSGRTFLAGWEASGISQLSSQSFFGEVSEAFNKRCVLEIFARSKQIAPKHPLPVARWVGGLRMS